MYASYLQVHFNPGKKSAAIQLLNDELIPQIKQAPGFVAGYWTGSQEGHDGLSMLVFESEDAARAAAEMVSTGIAPETVTLEGVEVREVVEHA